MMRNYIIAMLCLILNITTIISILRNLLLLVFKQLILRWLMSSVSPATFLQIFSNSIFLMQRAMSGLGLIEGLPHYCLQCFSAPFFWYLSLGEFVLDCVLDFYHKSLKAVPPLRLNRSGPHPYSRVDFSL